MATSRMLFAVSKTGIATKNCCSKSFLAGLSPRINAVQQRSCSSRGVQRDTTFKALDVDGDGKISREELDAANEMLHGDSWRTERYCAPPDDGHWGLIGAHPGQYPTLREAGQMVRYTYEMSNEQLLMLALQGNQDAAVERMIREVMHVDEVHWRQAAATVQEMDEYSGGAKSAFLRLPYTFGAGIALTSAVASVPLCFHTPTGKWFNTFFVTAELPPPEDLQTMLECGMWTWGWMEPPLGAISFVLLCLQFARQQTGHMWASAGAQGPYNAYLKRRRYKMLCEKYPQYSALIVQEYATILTARAGNKSTVGAINNDTDRQVQNLTAGDRTAAAASAI